MRLRIGVAGLVVVAVLGCSSDDELIPSFSKSETISSDTGGTVAVASSESAALGGTSIEIPAGALQADTEIEIGEANSDISIQDAIAAGPAVHFGPAGLVFNQPVTIRIPFFGVSALQVHAREGDGTTYVIRAPDVSVEMADGTSLVSFQVSGFTDFQAGRTGCDFDADCRSGHHCEHLPIALAASCSSSSDCGAGLACSAGSCSPVCSSATDCPADNTCLEGICMSDNLLLPPEGPSGKCVATTSGGECFEDSDCPGDGYCLGQVAEDVVVSDCLCAPGSACVAQVCRTLCNADSDCPSSDTCVEGLCSGAEASAPPLPPAEADCTSNADCQEDARCQEGDCVFRGHCKEYSDTPQVHSCGGQECSAGKVCLDGVCIAVCAGSSDCAAGSVCVEGVCVVVQP